LARPVPPRLGKRIRVSTKTTGAKFIGVVGDVYDDGVSKPPPRPFIGPLLMDHFESDDSFAFRDVAFVLAAPAPARKVS